MMLNKFLLLFNVVVVYFSSSVAFSKFHWAVLALFFVNFVLCLLSL